MTGLMVVDTDAGVVKEIEGIENIIGALGMKQDIQKEKTNRLLYDKWFKNNEWIFPTYRGTNGINKMDIFI